MFYDIKNQLDKPLMEMKYAMEFTSKYDKRWLDYYIAGQVKKLVDGILSNLNISEVEKQSRDSALEAEIEQLIDECVEYIWLKLKEGAK